MVALDRHAVGGLHAVLAGVPVDIAALDSAGHPVLFALEDHAEIGLVRRLLDRAVDQRLVMHDAPRLDPAGGGDDRLGRAIVDAHGQFVAAKPPKTTEWIAPIRVQASIASSASGTIGM